MISRCLGGQGLRNHQEGVVLTACLVIISGRFALASQHRIGHLRRINIDAIERHRGGGIVNRKPSGIAAIGLVGQLVTPFILHT